MRQSLILHPAGRREAVSRVEVDAARQGSGVLALTFSLTGSIEDLMLPPLGPTERADGLWRSSCFEAFVQAPPDEAYVELNFAPSARWAAYGFTGHRQGMTPIGGIVAPHIDVQRSPGEFTLAASVELAGVLPVDAAWRLGLTAVIENVAGGLSYWALAHPTGRADFHDHATFVCALPPQKEAR